MARRKPEIPVGFRVSARHEAPFLGFSVSGEIRCLRSLGWLWESSKGCYAGNIGLGVWACGRLWVRLLCVEVAQSISFIRLELR